jgi:triacylglycerol lipase
MSAMVLLALAAIAVAVTWWSAVTLEAAPQHLLERAAAASERDRAPAIVRRTSRQAVVLAHGLAGFDSIGVGELRVAYFRRVAIELERRGFDVVSARVPAVSALPLRAAALAAAVAQLPHERVTIVGHSMGGLDARWAISHGLAARVSDLITIGTPHRGTPVADILARGPAVRARRWIARLGLATDAIDWLTTWKLAELAAEMRDAAEVRYTSVVGVVQRIQVHPLLLAPHLYLTLVAGPNDGMVPESSQRWGTVILKESLDHFAQIGWAGGDAVDLIYRSLERLRMLPAAVVALEEPLALPAGGPPAELRPDADQGAAAI